MIRALALLLVVMLAPAARAQLPVFAGDPVDPGTSAPYIVLPGVPLVHPGEDEKFGTDDDVIDAGIVGDVDLVVRTGGGYAGGPIPPPHAGLGQAPLVTAGGTATGAGNMVAFQGILSDGQPPAMTGNPITGSNLNGRPVLAIAWGDLDGDGVIGPTAADGNADDEIERQELMAPVGRQAATITSGVASGTFALRLAAPASAGGLGVVVTAAATTGTTPYLYFDGPWIATLLPYMPPLDPNRIIGGAGQGGPDPTELLVDFELEFEKVFSPAPDHPILGTPYAIPLDGSSPTVDLLRSVGGTAAGVSCGRPVDPATFVAAPTRRLHPAVAPGGARVLFEEVDQLPLASDGAGGAAAVDCFLTDRLGNATDPPPGGYTVTLEAGPRLRIVSPDTDGLARSEPLAFTSAAAIEVIVDDAGLPAATPVADRVIVTRDAAPIGALRIALAAGPGGEDPSAPATLAAARLKLRSAPLARASLMFSALFDAGTASLDPATQDVTVTLGSPGTTVYTRTLSAGALRPNSARTTFRYRDPALGVRFIVRRSKRGATYLVKMKVKSMELTPPPPGALSLTATIGTSAFTGELACTPNTAGTLTKCTRGPRPRLGDGR